MKTLIKSIVLALSLGIVTSAASFANANPGGRATTVASYKLGIYTTNAGKIRAAIDKQTGGTIDIRLKKADGSVLFSRHLSRNEQNYRTSLDLNELEDGVYHLEITNGTEITTQTVHISTPKPTLTDRVITLN